MGSRFTENGEFRFEISLSAGIIIPLHEAFGETPSLLTNVMIQPHVAEGADAGHDEAGRVNTRQYESLFNLFGYNRGRGEKIEESEPGSAP